jgi:hypothetical protein
MLSGFPQLDGLLKKRGGINEAVQKQQPGQFQAMPTTQPRDMQVGQPQAEAPYQPNAQPTYQPTGGKPIGRVSQALFNQKQQDMNRGTFGALSKRRRF